MSDEGAAAQAQQEGTTEGTQEAAQQPSGIMPAQDPYPEEIYGSRTEDGRPEKIPAKYWKDGKVTWEGVLEERNFLSGKLGSFTGAPKDGYELPEPDGLQGAWDPDGLKPVLELFQKHNASQEFVNEVLGAYANMVAGDPEQLKAQRQEEMAKIGNDAEARIRDLNDFLYAQLPKNEAARLAGMVVSADDFKAIEALANKIKPSRLPKDGGPNPRGHTPESLREMREVKDSNGEPRMATDPEYAKRVRQAYREFYGEDES